MKQLTSLPPGLSIHQLLSTHSPLFSPHTSHQVPTQFLFLLISGTCLRSSACGLRSLSCLLNPPRMLIQRSIKPEISTNMAQQWWLGPTPSFVLRDFSPSDLGENEMMGIEAELPTCKPCTLALWAIPRPLWIHCEGKVDQNWHLYCSDKAPTSWQLTALHVWGKLTVLLHLATRPNDWLLSTAEKADIAQAEGWSTERILIHYFKSPME